MVLRDASASKKSGSGRGSGQVKVLKYSIGYCRVLYLLSGISEYAIFGHSIFFGHSPIEIPIEAKKFYGQQEEGSYIKNKNCFENRRPNGTT